MPKLFDSSGPVTLDRYSRFYSMEHRDLIAKESKEEFENTKLVKAREQLVFYSWSYFAVTNNLGKLLDSLRYDLDISEAALVNILRDRRAMFDDLAASLRILKEKLRRGN